MDADNRFTTCSVTEAADRVMDTDNKFPASSITEIVDRIFTGVVCQQDIDARVGEFVRACWEVGVVATPGWVVFAVENRPPVILTDWVFHFTKGGVVFDFVDLTKLGRS